MPNKKEILLGATLGPPLVNPNRSTRNAKNALLRWRRMSSCLPGWWWGGIDSCPRRGARPSQRSSAPLWRQTRQTLSIVTQDDADFMIQEEAPMSESPMTYRARWFFEWV